jgi:hypothetical protein
MMHPNKVSNLLLALFPMEPLRPWLFIILNHVLKNKHFRNVYEVKEKYLEFGH